jgi:uncharacterized glyoxalase superfamily protein PhnB
MQSIYPVLKYADAHAGIDFLERAFGFEGSREFTARDPEGNLWSFGTYRPG